MTFDSVSYAALLDVLSHHGPARASRLPRRVCARPFLPGVPAALVRTRVGQGNQVALAHLGAQPKVAGEPPLRPPFGR